MINEDIVDNAAIGVAQEAIISETWLDRRDVLCGDRLEIGESVCATNVDLAHMRNIEETGGGSCSCVLVDDAGILYRHFPSAKLHHLRAELFVPSVQLRLLHSSPISYPLHMEHSGPCRAHVDEY